MACTAVAYSGCLAAGRRTGVLRRSTPTHHQQQFRLSRISTQVEAHCSGGFVIQGRTAGIKRCRSVHCLHEGVDCAASSTSRTLA